MSHHQSHPNTKNARFLTAACSVYSNFISLAILFFAHTIVSLANARCAIGLVVCDRGPRAHVQVLYTLYVCVRMRA